MIADIQKSLKELIYAEAALPQDILDIRFATPTSAWIASLTRPTLNLFLYDLSENTGLRSMEFNTFPVAGGQQSQLAPRRVDLHYMVCVFFKSHLEELGRDEWNVLWRVLAALLKHEEWESKYVPEEAQRLGLGVLGRIGNISNQQTTNYPLFTSLGLTVRPHLHYTVTVPLDLNIALTNPLVLERRLDLYSGLEQDKPELMVRSSWLIRDELNQPVGDALVRVDDQHRGFTDSAGIVHLAVPRDQVHQLEVLTLDGRLLSIEASEAFLALPEQSTETEVPLPKSAKVNRKKIEKSQES